ncbi:glycosyltransferase [Cronobacter dublinensis]|uniref:glycosyltransferase n=1 Tax=Cronobacter dublinensis TaxID=413497 RepID=UPI001319BD38
MIKDDGRFLSTLVAVEPGAVAFLRLYDIDNTPTFNSEHYIIKQHDRLRKLLSSDIQWVIVDDASSDNTENTVKNFNNQFIIYHKLAKNSGPSIARHKV